MICLDPEGGSAPDQPSPGAPSKAVQELPSDDFQVRVKGSPAFAYVVLVVNTGRVGPVKVRTTCAEAVLVEPHVMRNVYDPGSTSVIDAVPELAVDCRQESIPPPAC